MLVCLGLYDSKVVISTWKTKNAQVNQKYSKYQKLNEKQTAKRKTVCEVWLSRHERKTFLHRIITRDKNWINLENSNRRKIWVFLLAGHNVHFIASERAKKSIFRPPSRKKTCATREKHLFYSCGCYPRSARASNFMLAK